MRNFFRKRRSAAVADERMPVAGGAGLGNGITGGLGTGSLQGAAGTGQLMGGPTMVNPGMQGPGAGGGFTNAPAFGRPGSSHLRPVDGSRGGLEAMRGPVAPRPPDVIDNNATGDRRGTMFPPPAGGGTESEHDLPRFTMSVNGGYRGGMGANAPAMLKGLTPELNGLLREAFTPTRPKQQLNGLFIGRNDTLRRIISAIEEERAHVILYGDRGRGKTSVANAIEKIAGQAGYLSLKLTCSGELSFEDIFRHFLKKIPSTYYRSSQDNPFAARRNFASFNELLPEGTFSVTELNEVLSGIHATHVLLILDEYDRVTDEDFRNKLAELFKNLTDSSIPVTLLVVGVAENLDQLLGKHPSIQRSLVPVHLPLMTDQEIGRLIQAGAQNAGIEFAPDVVRRIAEFVRGLPYYAQLLGLHAARSAVSRGSKTVERPDLAYAVARCLQEAERGIVESYARALAADRRMELEDALLAAALCPADAYGVFDPKDLAGEDGEPPSAATLDLLKRLTREDHGGVLAPVVEPGRERYRFRNQMMRQYVLMRQASERGQI
ncbi:AAA family ATPase [Azospirillum picis]|uniref:Cdc6-like AAA superfamily ATPase n=1 Tax=Azospirillum picis TaxID=488438 RepID=A0ABU0MGP8_9PROT|nr:ATP-binding protein [Azospirillum picis]MBP2298348.1 Cdc6-like AAA superfamily ATPase [Azospirillum picis]MDQ0532603.1 Cdc6-like AAA superfamily ATPase [Azospirillum picis]